MEQLVPHHDSLRGQRRSCCGTQNFLFAIRSRNFDRCHSLPSLLPPPAAVGSLPYAVSFVSFLTGQERHPPEACRNFAKGFIIATFYRDIAPQGYFLALRAQGATSLRSSQGHGCTVDAAAFKLPLSFRPSRRRVEKSVPFSLQRGRILRLAALAQNDILGRYIVPGDCHAPLGLPMAYKFRYLPKIKGKLSIVNFTLISVPWRQG